MAGKTIYLVYDPLIEDEKSLQDFIVKILQSAKFPIENLYLVDKEKALQVVNEDERQYYICINSTYVNTTIHLARQLDVTPHRFFSRFYKDPDKKILALGLVFSIKDILSGDKTTKLNVWEKVNDFLKCYLDYEDQETIEEVQEETVIEPVINTDNSNIIIGDLSISTAPSFSDVSYNYEKIIKDLDYKEKVKLLSLLQTSILLDLKGV